MEKIDTVVQHFHLRYSLISQNMAWPPSVPVSSSSSGSCSIICRSSVWWWSAKPMNSVSLVGEVLVQELRSREEAGPTHFLGQLESQEEIQMTN